MKLEYSVQFEQIWGYLKAILLIRWQTRLPGCLISIARLPKDCPATVWQSRSEVRISSTQDT